MKIRNLPAPGSATHPTGLTVHRGDAGGGAFFREHLVNVNRQNAAQQLKAMGEAIFDQGEQVASHADIGQLKKYREMIAEFLNEAVRYAYEFSKESRLDARGRHRIYAVVKRVNDRLEELAKEILAEQQNNIAIMETIGDIKGMLLDVLM